MNLQFEAEVKPHLSRLRVAARRLKGNQMDAEDLVQETLYRAFRFWNRFTPGTNCKAWLLRILNNQHINDWRTTSRRAYSVDIDRVPETDLARLAQIPIMKSSPEQDMISQTLDDDLHSALGQLKPDNRIIVHMYFFRDLSYRQIAQQTHLSLGTIKSKLYRSRQLMRKNLNEYAATNR